MGLIETLIPSWGERGPRKVLDLLYEDALLSTASEGGKREYSHRVDHDAANSGGEIQWMQLRYQNDRAKMSAIGKIMQLNHFPRGLQSPTFEDLLQVYSEVQQLTAAHHELKNIFSVYGSIALLRALRRNILIEAMGSPLDAVKIMYAPMKDLGYNPEDVVAATIDNLNYIALSSNAPLIEATIAAERPNLRMVDAIFLRESLHNAKKYGQVDPDNRIRVDIILEKRRVGIENRIAQAGQESGTRRGIQDMVTVGKAFNRKVKSIFEGNSHLMLIE